MDVGTYLQALQTYYIELEEHFKKYFKIIKF